MEIWKSIIGNYEISNYGRVRNNKTNYILKAQDNGRGYDVVKLCVDRNIHTYKVHRLVAQCFIDNPDNKEQVNHKDGNKKNNHVDNLEWCTNKENAYHAIKNGLWTNVFKASYNSNERRKKAIIAKNIETGEIKRFNSISQAEREYNTRHICDVLKGKRSHTKGYSFYYEGGD